MADKKALAFLKKFYLTGKEERRPSVAEKENAIKSGFIMPETETSHDEIVAEVKALSDRISIESVAKAFLYSLTSGDLRYRSALSSLVWAKSLPEHKMILRKPEKYDWRAPSCNVCGCSHGLKKKESVDWNEYDVFRYLSPKEIGNTPDLMCAEYALNDLREFEKLPEVEPRDEDYRILNGIFACAKEMKSHNMDTALVGDIRRKKFVDATGNGIHCILGTLSICGILESAEQKGFLHSFTNNGDFRDSRDCLTFYPLYYWRGKNGVNYDAVNEIFGSFSADKLSPERAELPRNAAPIVPKKKAPSKTDNYFTDGVYTIMLTNEERRYLALDPLDPSWETETSYYATDIYKTRTVIFYKGNTIVKVIYEEHFFNSDGSFRKKEYQEIDTRLETENRTTLLPLTSKGRAKPVTPSNVLAIKSLGAELIVGLESDNSYIMAGKLRNYQYIPIGEEDRIEKIMSDDDFHEFMKYYIATCPDNYFDLVSNVRNMEHQTVKFRAGDVFRIQEDRTHFTYGLIMGKTRELEKWPECPKEHSFRHLMMQPLIIRMFDFVTTDKDLTLEQIAENPLRAPEYCADADIIWGRHKIVAHKELEPDDILFKLQFGLPLVSLSDDESIQNCLHIEWGFSSTDVPWESIPDNVRQAFHEVRYYDHGVCTVISGSQCGKSYDEILKKFPNNKIRKDPLQPANRGYFNIIMTFLGLPENCTLDEFAAKYGGLSRQEYIDLVEKRCK